MRKIKLKETMVLKKTTVLEREGTENEVSCYLCLLLPPHLKPLKKPGF